MHRLQKVFPAPDMPISAIRNGGYAEGVPEFCEVFDMEWRARARRLAIIIIVNFQEQLLEIVIGDK